MSQPGGDDFLIDLFREEVRTHSQVLADGLVAVEQGAAPERLAAMMRAAHSIKGAARVVNVQPAVELAHAMEDCFVRRFRGRGPVPSSAAAARRPAGQCSPAAGCVPRVACGMPGGIRPPDAEHGRLEHPFVSRSDLQPDAAVSRRSAGVAATGPRPCPAARQEGPA